MGQQIIRVRGQLGEEKPGLLGGLFGPKQTGQEENRPPSGGDPGNAQAPPAPALSLPLAGAWARALAFLIDGVALYFLAQLWVPALTPAMQDHTVWLATLGTAVFLAYFVILNGPIGKGQTLGKKLMQITTRRLDGAPLGWGESLARAAIQCLPILITPLIAAISIAGETEAQRARNDVWMACLLLNPCYIFPLANFIVTARRSDKRSLHDLACGAFVFKADQLDKAREFIAEASLRNNRAAAMAALIVALTVLGALEYLTLQAMHRNTEYVACIQELETAHSLPGYQIRMTLEPIREPQAKSAPPQQENSSQTLTREKGPTTEPVRMVLVYTHEGRADESALRQTLQDSALTTQAATWLAEQYRAPKTEIFKEINKLTSPQSRFPLARIDVVFYERLSVPFFMGSSHHRLVHQAQFPFESRQ